MKPAPEKWDVYVESGATGEIEIVRVRSANPDDAIYELKLKGIYLPEGGDRIIRCIKIRDRG